MEPTAIEARKINMGYSRPKYADLSWGTFIATIFMLRIVVFILLSLFGVSTYAGPFEDCILKNMKGVQAQGAAQAIYRACAEKTTPKACRDKEIASRIEAQYGPAPNPSTTRSAFDDLTYAIYQNQIKTETDSCLRRCATATYWSRTFGECSTD